MLPTSKRAALVAPVLLGVLLASCGDDDDGRGPNTVLIGAPGTEAESTETGDDGATVVGSVHDIPSLEEVGRASFSHTIVAGDFLRSIADTYDVEIDDIVGANEWEDGREHLLLAGDEIFLPADATMPEPEPTTIVAAQTTAAAQTEPPAEVTVSSVAG